MKKWHVFPVVLILFLSEHVFSQENIIKTSVTSAFFGDFNLAYERVLNDKSSIQVKAGYINPMVSFTIGEKRITPDDYWLQKDKGGFHTSVEYRFYLNDNKETPQGLYIAPYLRHFNQNLLYTDTIHSDLFDVKMKVNNFGIGAQFGVQWIFNEVFTLDFYFMGLGLDYYIAKLKYTLQNPRTGFDYSSITDDIDETLSEVSYLHKRADHTPQSTWHDTKIPFLAPGFRFGLRAGIAF